MVVIFVRNKTYSPSCYYRIIQYIEENEFVLVSEFSLDIYYKSKRTPDIIKKLFYGFFPGHFRRIKTLFKLLLKKDYVIFVQREIFPKKIFLLEKFLLKKIFQKSKKIIWDIDDNIFFNNEISKSERKLLFNYSTDVISCNDFLLDKFKNSNILKHKIYTSDRTFENIDLENINLWRKKIYNETIYIIWVGTKSNKEFLEEIIPSLDQTAKILRKYRKKLILKIVSNFKILKSYEFLKIQNISWSRNNAKKEMLISHIGIMPLKDTEYTRGKCAFKAIQYMSAGLPVIISPVGLNNEVINHGESGFFAYKKNDWIDYVVLLSTKLNIWERISFNSRLKWEQNYNTLDIKKKYYDILGLGGE